MKELIAQWDMTWCHACMENGPYGPLSLILVFDKTTWPFGLTRLASIQGVPRCWGTSGHWGRGARWTIGWRSRWGGGIERLGPVHENEFLDALDGEEVEPVYEFDAMRGHGATGEVDAMEGPRCASRTWDTAIVTALESASWAWLPSWLAPGTWRHRWGRVVWSTRAGSSWDEKSAERGRHPRRQAGSKSQELRTSLIVVLITWSIWCAYIPCLFI